MEYCKYCKPKWCNILGMNNSLVNKRHQDIIGLDTYKKYIYIDSFYACVDVRVNYCPMCGRKLDA